MGIFSKLKNLTGGWADVSVVPGEGTRGGFSEVTIQISVKDDPIQVNRIYLTVKCVEEVRVPNYKIPKRGSEPAQPSVNVSATETLHEQEYTASGALSLDGGAHDAILHKVDIPQHLPPTYEGRNARIRWMVKAGLDMSGNDPDSGWKDLIVK